VLATGAVIAMPLVALGLLAGLVAWARDAVSHRTPIGTAGVLIAAAAIGNLFIERRLGAATTRPVLALFLERDDAFRSALLALAVAVLLVVATSVAVRLARR